MALETQVKSIDARRLTLETQARSSAEFAQHTKGLPLSQIYHDVSNALTREAIALSAVAALHREFLDTTKRITDTEYAILDAQYQKRLAPLDLEYRNAREVSKTRLGAYARAVVHSRSGVK